MEILHNYEFKRPSRSRYADAIKALTEDGVFAVRLKRGEDFPDNVPMNSIQGGIKDAFKKTSGRSVKTHSEGDEAVVVTLQPEGHSPKTRKKRARGEALTAS